MGGSKHLTLSLIAAGLLASCNSKDASHIPPIWEIPGAVIGGGIENAVYGAKRKRVEAHVSANFDAIIADMRSGSGPALARAFELAGVTEAKHDELIADILGNPDIYLEGPPAQNIENLVVAFMVHGD